MDMLVTLLNLPDVPDDDIPPEGPEGSWTHRMYWDTFVQVREEWHRIVLSSLLRSNNDSEGMLVSVKHGDRWAVELVEIVGLSPNDEWVTDSSSVPPDWTVDVCGCEADRERLTEMVTALDRAFWGPMVTAEVRRRLLDDGYTDPGWPTWAEWIAQKRPE